jgi:hypothetical protein
MPQESVMPREPDRRDGTWTEEIMVRGSELVDRVKELVSEGNVRRLIIKKPGGDTLIEIPLTAGVLAGGAMILIAPLLAVLGAIAGMLAEVKVEVVRSGAPKDEGQSGE